MHLRLLFHSHYSLTSTLFAARVEVTFKAIITCVRNIYADTAVCELFRLPSKRGLLNGTSKLGN